MNRFRYWVRDFFGFPRAHVNGFIILLFLVNIFLFSEPVWHWWVSRREPDFTMDQRLLDSLILVWDTSEIEETTKLDSFPDFFRFDPNTISKANLESLGFSESLSTRMLRYREKGGIFRIKKDLLKIYGVDSTFYRRLQDYIMLPDRLEVEKKEPTNHPSKPIFANQEKFQKFDINSADTSQLKRIYGIGEKLSMRIIKYRDALGGFVALDQLREVYGLDSVVIGQLLKQTTLDTHVQPEKLNINAASEKQLAMHPYFSKVAKAIVLYRFQHGDFKTVDELRNIGSLDENAIKKITPYSKVSDDL